MFYGLGIDVPYVKSGTTVVGHPVADNSGTCGSSFAVQQMLTDLGYPVGTVDGQFGTKTFTALKSFSAEAGASYPPGSYPKSGVCQALIDAWSAKKSPTATAAVVVPTTTPSGGAGTSVQTVPVPAGSLPAGQKPTGAVAPVAPGAGALDKAKAWWAAQGTPVKIGVAGGGLLVLGLLGYALSGSGSTPVATPNSRIRSPGGWLVVKGNRVLSRHKLKRAAMSSSRRRPGSYVVSMKSWGY